LDTANNTSNQSPSSLYPEQTDASRMDRRVLR
jgi:hypothetical protein